MHWRYVFLALAHQSRVLQWIMQKHGSDSGVQRWAIGCLLCAFGEKIDCSNCPELYGQAGWKEGEMIWVSARKTNSSALAMELRLSCTNPSICQKYQYIYDQCTVTFTALKVTIIHFVSVITIHYYFHLIICHFCSIQIIYLPNNNQNISDVHSSVLNYQTYRLW